MRKVLILLLILAVVGALGVSLAGNACPDKSKNPNGTPPDCGHPPAPSPTPTQPAGTTCDNGHSTFAPQNNETGLASTIVHGIDQNAAVPAPVGGDGGVLAEVNCALIAELGL
jgi:hypothetical protein